MKLALAIAGPGFNGLPKCGPFLSALTAGPGPGPFLNALAFGLKPFLSCFCWNVDFLSCCVLVNFGPVLTRNVAFGLTKFERGRAKFTRGCARIGRGAARCTVKRFGGAASASEPV